jgi:hypothetical protein
LAFERGQRVAVEVVEGVGVVLLSADHAGHGVDGDQRGGVSTPS